MDKTEKNQFDFAAFEKPLMDRWYEKGYFHRTPGFGKYAQDTYTITIPPPNITGVLHMGHALNDTIQDTCIRRARMQGKRTHWVLGTDHAGISTQTKVDKRLAEQGVSRLQIGREKFIEECYKWYEEYGTTIVNQIRGMGCSVDFDEEHFTLEPEYVKAVRKLFVDWYHDNLIYKGKRIVNWCPSCTTSISDDEAEYVEEDAHLYYLRYPLVEPVDGMEYIVVATTRPETMLGDVGVAFSPKHPKAALLEGKKLMLPLVGREIPLFSDYHVNPEFGTGFVKVTPAHDANDYAMGERAGLERINIFDETAHVVAGYGEFSGLSREGACKAVIEALDAQGYLDHIEDYRHSVMTCYRCHTKLEPWLSEQWFVAVDGLKKAALKPVEDGTIKFYPERWSQVYIDWMNNLKDWCVSRQLWWGHRIPMFYCDVCGWEDASVDDITTCPQCAGTLRQDEDVLDTWFSSQLWPFAVMGWTEEGVDAPEMKLAYPTQMLSTARDIMGLWVARMVMASMYCTGEIPFHDVIIHPTVMAADGKPMSKSRGNGVDPLRLMKDYGADGMRYGLLMQVTGSQDLRFNEAKLESSRNFANKIKNAARFVMMNLEGYTPGEPEIKTAADAWIFSRLACVFERVDRAYESYEFGDITRELYSFVWNEFCDWYIEFAKAYLNNQEGSVDNLRLSTQRNLIFLLDQIAKILHPIMPFVTEEIYQELPIQGKAEDLIIAPWPCVEELAAFKNEEAERSYELVIEIISALRSMRARYSLSPKEQVEALVKLSNERDLDLIAKQQELIMGLGRCSKLELSLDAQKPAQSATFVGANAEVFMILAGLIDFEAEKKRLEKELEQCKKDFERFNKKLSNEGFLSKAAPEIIQKDTAKRDSLALTIERLEAQLKDF